MRRSGKRVSAGLRSASALILSAVMPAEGFQVVLLKWSHFSVHANEPNYSRGHDL